MPRLLIICAMALLTSLVAPGAAFGQQTTVEESGRRLAPPMPPFATTVVPLASIRAQAPPFPSPGVTTPPLPPGRQTAPPMPTIITAPVPRPPSLPRPCLFGRFFCDESHLYVSFGDSIARGALAVKGYVPRYAKVLKDSTGIRAIRIRNLAVNGMTTAELAAALAPNTPGREALAQAHIVTWNIGGNDFRAARTLYKQGQCGGTDNQDCLRSTLASFTQSWDQIVQIMQQTKANRPTLMRSMDIYNPYVREDLATDSWPGDSGNSDYHVLRPYLASANDHIAQSLTAANIPFIKLSDIFNDPSGLIDPFDRGYLSRDGFHPNDNGHKVIAGHLWNLGWNDLP